MTVRIRVVPAAERELLRAAERYESLRPGLGAEFVLAIDMAIARIAENPRAYGRWKSNRQYRRCVLERFPFVVVFVDDPAETTVLAIAHTKRRPGYWMKRTPG